MYKPVIAILLGDGAGVGPEIVADLIGRRFFDSFADLSSSVTREFLTALSYSRE